MKNSVILKYGYLFKVNVCRPFGNKSKARVGGGICGIFRCQENKPGLELRMGLKPAPA